MARALLANFVLLLLLAGCSHDPKIGSVIGGECRAFERPEYAVKGRAPYDQAWIDGNVEAGVGACGWARPQPRPPALDAPKRKSAKAAAAPVKRPSFAKRVTARIKAIVRPAAVPAAPPASAPPAPAAEVAPAPPPAPSPPRPRDPVDDLLDPQPRSRR